MTPFSTLLLHPRLFKAPCDSLGTSSSFVKSTRVHYICTTPAVSSSMHGRSRKLMLGAVRNMICSRSVLRGNLAS